MSKLPLADSGSPGHQVTGSRVSSGIWFTACLRLQTQGVVGGTGGLFEIISRLLIVSNQQIILDKDCTKSSKGMRLDVGRGGSHMCSSQCRQSEGL